MEQILKKRKGFNFYRSYYDVFWMLSEKDRLNFITAILDKQFQGIDTELEGMALLAYTGQKHSIDSQVEGFLNKMKGTQPPTEPPSYVSNDSVMTTEPPTEPPYQQEQGKEQGKEEVKGQEQVQAEDVLEEWLNKRK